MLKNFRHCLTNTVGQLIGPAVPMRLQRILLRAMMWPIAVSLVAATLAPIDAQDLIPKGDAEQTTNERKLSREEEAFRQLLEGAKLTGRFTSDSKDLADTRDESYEIRNVRKLDDVDLWGLETRVRYGDRDMTVPVAIQVQFSVGVPVIVLKDVTIPGMGTFSAAVVFHKGRYAGSWQHDDKGGHLFGTVSKIDSAE